MLSPLHRNSTAYVVGLLSKGGDWDSSAAWSPVSQQGCGASEPHARQAARHEAVGEVKQLSKQPDVGFLPFCPLLHVVVCPLLQFSGQLLHLRCWVCVWLVQLLLVTARRSECPTCCLMGTFHPAAELVSVHPQGTQSASGQPWDGSCLPSWTLHPLGDLPVSKKGESLLCVSETTIIITTSTIWGAFIRIRMIRGLLLHPHQSPLVDTGYSHFTNEKTWG